MTVLEPLRKKLLGAFAVMALAVGAAWAMRAPAFYHAYLLGYVFCTGIAVGCLGLLLVQYVTGGAWGAAVRRLLESASLTLPVLLVLFVPVVIGFPRLYGEGAHLKLYLREPFFIGRTVFYFLIWIGLTVALQRWSDFQDRQGDRGASEACRRISAVGLVLYVLSVSFAAVDWMMALEPHWYSTIYGLLVLTGQGLTALCVIIIATAGLRRRGLLPESIGADIFHDLGNLLLAFVMFYTYLAFSQFLLIWSGNLPEENVWILKRIEHGWQYAIGSVVLFNFALPFLVLLAREAKRRPEVLSRLAVLILVFRFIDTAWLVMPAFQRAVFPFSWLFLAVPAALGLGWTALFLGGLGKRPIFPARDPEAAGLITPGH